MKIKLFFVSLLILILLFLVSCSQNTNAQISQAGITTSGAAGEQSASAQNSETSTTSSTVLTTNTNVSQGFSFPNATDVENRFTIQDALPGIKFNRPVDFENAKDGSGRIFVVEQQGRINVVETTPSIKSAIFLDISSRVDSSSNEMGLLGLAFHPLFKENGLFYVNYTTSNSTVISSFSIDPNNPNIADPLSEKILLTFPQPYTNHKGGKLAFGSNDGYLYIGAGDGGSEGDPQGNGQKLSTLLGKILRIDINNKDQGLAYSIPPDNPFAGNNQGNKQEIFAYGLRNPWRFSFDSQTGFLWVGDVGQNRMEEIDIVDRGKNYGWNIMEGSLCYNPPSGCNTSGLELPLYEYSHSIGDAIIGGYVYHGKQLPILQNAYIYGDYGSGLIWGLWYRQGNKPQNYTLASTNLNISSFGIDENDEIYLAAFDGKIYSLKLKP